MESQSRSRESLQAPVGGKGPSARAREVVGSTGVRGGESIPPETRRLWFFCLQDTATLSSACSLDPDILPFPDTASRGRKTQTAALIGALTRLA